MSIPFSNSARSMRTPSWSGRSKKYLLKVSSALVRSSSRMQSAPFRRGEGEREEGHCELSLKNVLVWTRANTRA